MPPSARPPAMPPRVPVAPAVTRSMMPLPGCLSRCGPPPPSSSGPVPDDVTSVCVALGLVSVGSVCVPLSSSVS